VGLRHLDAERRRLWEQRLDVAESSHPADVPKNGWTVAAAAGGLVGHHHQCTGRGGVSSRASASGLDTAVRAGYDTDTVAAIAGGLLGAAYGASAVPLEWRALLHGWPDLNAHDLVGLGSAIARCGKPDPFDFSYSDSPIDTMAVHPHDDKVVLGGVWGAAPAAG